MKILRTVLIAALFLIVNQIVAQDSGDWTPENIIFQEGVGSMQFSPDNTMAVWTKRRADKEKDRFISDIYLTRFDMVKDGMPRTIQMTSQDESDYNPIFSQDGEKIYFLSSRDKGNKLWAMEVLGGEPKRVADFPNGIRSMRLGKEGTVLFISNDGKSLYEEETKKDNTVVVEDTVHRKVTRVYSYDLEKKQTQRLTDNKYPITGFSSSNRGRYLVTFVSTRPAFGGQSKVEIYLYDVETGNGSVILSNHHTPGNFQFSNDDNGFYFTDTKTSNEEWYGAGIQELYYYNLNNKLSTRVNLDWDNGIGGGFRVIGNNIIASLANGPVRTLAYYFKEGSSWTKHPLDFGPKTDHVRLLSVSSNSANVAFTHSTASQLPKFYTAEISVRRNTATVNNEREFVQLNSSLKDKEIAKSEILYWTGAKDEQVNGILYYPEDYEAGKRYPLVISIHGGPTGVDMDSWSERWSTYPQVYSQRGAFVLKPNYHGSGNHSQEFVESISGGVYYDLEEIDILNGINHLEALGYIDMEKLGIMGWSNGAILATMMTLRYPDMFKAAAPGAGDVNWTSDYGTCQFGVTFDQYYFGGAPWDDKDGKSYNETYIIKSPLFEIEKIKTPTIIFHGSEDRAVPRDQGWEYYRGLQQVGKAPVRFLWFPGQPHGLQKITHQLRKMNEEIAWFDKYLFGTLEESNEAFKKSSPLARRLEMNDVMSHNGLVGEWMNDVLVPEVVEIKSDSISIGRFEVTNAQYAYYQEDHRFDQTSGNYPVFGLSKSEIDGYLEWLNNKTGRNYRLPNLKEGRALHEKAVAAAPNENSLNYWAGYDLTLKDAEMLSSKLDDLQSTLLMAVGQFNPVTIHDAKVYDLGGNVAEYYNESGTLRVAGYSAYDFADPLSSMPKKDTAYIGFRVVLDPD